MPFALYNLWTTPKDGDDLRFYRRHPGARLHLETTCVQ